MLKSTRLPPKTVLYRYLLRKNRSISKTAHLVTPTRLFATTTTAEPIYSSNNRRHARRPYEFHIGCSYAGKPEDPTEKLRKVPFPPDTLIGGWRDKMLAWPKSVPFRSAGEDFFFVQEVRNSSYAPGVSTRLNACETAQYVPFSIWLVPAATQRTAVLTYSFLALEGVSFGVADGVGGWIDSGVDPSLFSQSLMYHAHRYSRNAWAGEPEIDPTMDYEEREQIEGWEMTPYECLDLAYGGVLREKFVQAGSSTACIISLNASSGVLRSANWHLVRAILFRQLTKLPPNSARKFSRACVDAPSEAEVLETKLRDGDIVVAYVRKHRAFVWIRANIPFIRRIFTLALSNPHIPPPCNSQPLRDLRQPNLINADRRLLRQCLPVGGEHQSNAPIFAGDAASQGMFFRGGKPDDVTVIVALTFGHP
ncbi:hypothetical protein NMY22_g2549 [Coprinellus aureogranulatus]|nr:hypothetical protein NMY22_g2549 [Coprinellus aureogranulatus]